MAITEFTSALNQVATERNIKVEEVMASLEEALIAAYRKDNPEITEEDVENITAKISEETGEVQILKDGKDVTPAGFGRIASQTAKQVILQKIREAEKHSIASEYRELIGTITQGYIFRIDKETVIMDIGKTQGILPLSEQIPSERYSVNQKYKVLIKDVTEESAGSTIILSRKDPKFIEELFIQEVPEMEKGVVKIESIAREAGGRTKIAVSSSDSKIDPSGACIGQRGIRVQAVTDELNGEKIDIINHSPSSDKYIAASLAPAHDLDVVLNESDRTAKVTVSEGQLSLAIGKEGQNARLAAKLTGWGISIAGVGGEEVNVDPSTTPEEMKGLVVEEAVEAPKKVEEEVKEEKKEKKAKKEKKEKAEVVEEEASSTEEVKSTEEAAPDTESTKEEESPKDEKGPESSDENNSTDNQNE